MISPVFAQIQFNTDATSPACLQAAEGIYSRALSAAFWIAGVGVLLALLSGGFKYMLAQGDEKAMMSAKQTITYGVGGLVLAILAYAVLKGFDLAFLKVNASFGPFLKFSIPGLPSGTTACPIIT